MGQVLGEVGKLPEVYNDIARMHLLALHLQQGRRQQGQGDYEQAAYEVVRCDEHDMEQERKTLLSGIFDSGCSSASASTGTHSPKSKSKGKVKGSKANKRSSPT